MTPPPPSHAHTTESVPDGLAQALRLLGETPHGIVQPLPVLGTRDAGRVCGAVMSAR